jgi:hypothetical protein
MFDLLDESGGGPHTLLLLFVIDFVRSWNEALVSWAGGASATDASGAAGASGTDAAVGSRKAAARRPSKRTT